MYEIQRGFALVSSRRQRHSTSAPNSCSLHGQAPKYEHHPFYPGHVREYCTLNISPTWTATRWANMYLAYDMLSELMKQLVSSLRAVHSFAKNFTPERFHELGIEDRRDEMYVAHLPVSHPVARTNPETRRKALFVNQDFTSHIEGVPSRESDALLRFLYEHMAQPEFQVRWRWEAGKD